LAIPIHLTTNTAHGYLPLITLAVILYNPYQKGLTDSKTHFKVTTTQLRHTPMKVIALTGGIGSGKTTIRQFFSKAGIITLDADAIGRALVAKNQPGLVEITRTFGQDMLLPNGELDRTKLKALIFSDPHAKQQLEAILHPLIRTETQRKLTCLEQAGTQVVIVEIPLLVETGIPDYIHQVIVLDLPRALQIERVMARDHCSKETVIQILNQQASQSERLAIADYIIDTAQPLDNIERQVQQIIASIHPADDPTETH